MHYTSLFTALEAAAKAAWSPAGIFPGRLSKPLYTLPRVVITLESVDRKSVGRQIQQTWNWSIGAEFADPANTVDVQGYLAAKAEAFENIVTPFSENPAAVPSVPAPFGGVGYMPLVTNWAPVPQSDDDNSVGLILTFSVTTSVWQ